jgi:hypothetical protein
MMTAFPGYLKNPRDEAPGPSAAALFGDVAKPGLAGSSLAAFATLRCGIGTVLAAMQIISNAAMAALGSFVGQHGCICAGVS